MTKSTEVTNAYTTISEYTENMIEQCDSLESQIDEKITSLNEQQDNLTRFNQAFSEVKQFLDVLAITSEEFADTVAELEDLDIQY